MVPVIDPTRSHTSLMDLPRTSTPFTSRISSPSWSKPERSATPPLTIRPTTTDSPSFLTVAPCRRRITNRQRYRFERERTPISKEISFQKGETYQWLVGFLQSDDLKGPILVMLRRSAAGMSGRVTRQMWRRDESRFGHRVHIRAVR